MSRSKRINMKHVAIGYGFHLFGDCVMIKLTNSNQLFMNPHHIGVERVQYSSYRWDRDL